MNAKGLLGKAERAGPRTEGVQPMTCLEDTSPAGGLHQEA